MTQSSSQLKCERKNDVNENPLVIDENLIIIKIDDNTYICLTREEANYIIDYDLPIGDTGEENLPVIEQPGPIRSVDLGLLMRLQGDQNNWYYRLITTGQWINHTFRDLLKRNVNSMILKPEREVILYRSTGVGGMHDQKHMTYSVKPAKRCDFYPDMICDKPDKFNEPLQTIKDEFKIAVYNSYSKDLRLLLMTSDIDPSLDDNYAIKTACENGYTEIVKILLTDDRINPGIDKNYCLAIACKKGFTEIVKMLLADNRVNPGDNNNIAFKNACEYGHIEIVRLLIAQSPRIDPIAQHYAFEKAIEKGHTHIVKLLLTDPRINPKINPAGKNNEAIKSACYHGQYKIVKMLLEDSRVDPGIDNNYCIGVASRNGYTDIVKELISNEKVNPAANNNYAYRMARINNHSKIIKILLQDSRVQAYNLR